MIYTTLKRADNGISEKGKEKKKEKKRKVVNGILPIHVHACLQLGKNSPEKRNSSHGQCSSV